MKKLLVILLACVLCLQALTIPSFAFNDIDDSEFKSYVSLLSGLGIVNGYEDGSFRPDEIASRAEFAVMLARLMNMEELVSGDGKPYFTDVSGDSFARGAISYCVEAGIMSGYGNGIFMPDKPVTFDEVVKTLVNLLGYRFYAKNEGEYPFGYRIEAKQLGLLSGVESKNANPISRGEICALMYNALKIPLLEVTGVGESYTVTEDPSVTILTQYFNMTMEKGIINGDGITKIEYVADVDSDSVVFNNIPLKKNGKYTEDFLGKSVEVIYTLDTHDTPNRLISIAENTKLTSQFTLSAEDIVRVSSQNVIYEENDVEEKLYISASRKVVNNGIFDFTYDLSGIVNNPDTTVTFIDNDGDKKYDVLKVNKAKNYILMDKIGEKRIIRDITDGTKTLNLEDIEIVEVFDADGNRLGDEEYYNKTANIASVFRNGNYYAKVVLVTESYSGMISYIETDEDGEILLLNDNAELKLNSGYKTENSFLLKMGETITAYTDINGKVCYIKAEGSTGYKLGYLMTAKVQTSFEGNIMFKIFTRENTTAAFECAEKIKLNDDMMNREKDKNLILSTLYRNTTGGYSQFILYMTDDEGKITEIHQYSDSPEDTENKFFRFVPSTSPRFSTGTYSFGGIANTDSATWLIKVPSGDAADATAEDFAIYRTSQIVSESYPIEFYVTSTTKQTADIVAFTGDKVPMSITYDDYLCVLIKSVQSVDSEGNLRTKLKYFSNGDEHEKIVGEYATSTTISNIGNMEPGEVFSLVEDNKGEIMDVERYYSLKDGWVGSLVNGHPQNNTYGATRRVAAYYVSYITGGYARCSFDPVIANSYNAQLLETVNLPGSNVFTLVRKSANGSVQIEKGSDKDISILDLLVTRTRGGSDREVIIIKQ